MAAKTSDAGSGAVSFKRKGEQTEDECASFIPAVPKPSETKPEPYGWSGFSSSNFAPLWIQFLNHKKAFLIVYSLTTVLQGTFHTYFVSVITTLEKLFSIPSRTTGILMATTEIGQVSSSLLLPYFISSGHRPRWMGFGTIVFAAASLLTASLHLILPPVIPGPAPEQDYCLTDETECKNEASSNILLYLILSLSLLCIGFGQTAVYTLGIPYLDDNVGNRDSPVYFSITIGVRILGPVMGFILGSFTTRLYIYPFIDPGYDQSNPHWLGAWWLGMLIISILLFLISIFLSGFPKVLKISKSGREELEKGEEGASLAAPPILTTEVNPPEEEKINGELVGSSLDEAAGNGRSPKLCSIEEEPFCGVPEIEVQPTNSINTRPSLRNFPSAIKRLLTNRILMLRTLSSVFHLLPISGLYTFLPKYLESQFQLTAADAAMLTGILGILVMGIGILGSGWFIRRWLPTAKGIALWVAIAAGIYSLGMFGLVFVGCDGNQVVGGGETHLIQTQNLISSESCQPCNCSQSNYMPLCGSDQIMYVSPCHAGCSVLEVNGTIEYQNCSCILTEPHTATPSLCPLNCSRSNLVLYFVIFIAIVLIHSTSEVGSMLLTLRCVESKDKALALGLVQFSIGLFGNVPCPVLYGWLVDRNCSLWGKDCNLNSENCWLYDNRGFREVFHGTTAALMFVGFLFDLLIYYLADDIWLSDG